MRRLCLSLLLLLATASPAWATAYTSTQAGNWSSAATWGGSGPPGAGDTAIIATALGQTVTGAANNGSGLVRLTMASTAKWTTGTRCYVESVTGTTEANGGWVVTVVDSTHLDLQGSTFVNAWVSGGSCMPTVLVDVNTTVGSKTSGVGSAVTINGTSATSYGVLEIASGVTLTCMGYDRTVNYAMNIAQYGVFHPLPGSTMAVDCASNGQTFVNANGRVLAYGTVANPITFTVPTANASWAAQATNVSITNLYKKYDIRRNVYNMGLGQGNIANTAGTALATVGGGAVTFSSFSDATMFQNEKSSPDLVLASGDYYIDYVAGNFWAYSTSSNVTGGKATYKYYDVATANLRGWSFHHGGNTSYSEAVFDQCVFLSMGYLNNGAQDAVIYASNKYSDGYSSNTHRKVQVTNCQFLYTGRGVMISYCNGSAGNPILISNNTFTGTVGDQQYNWCINAYGPEQYVTISANKFLPANNGNLITLNATYHQVTNNANWVITNNVCRGGYCILTVGDQTPMPDLSCTNNVFTGTAIAYDCDAVLNVSGTSGHPAIIQNNVFSHNDRDIGYSNNCSITGNVFLYANHHGIMATPNTWYVYNTAVTNNVFVVNNCDNASILVGYNITTFVDGLKIEHNTIVGSTGNGGITFGDLEGGVQASSNTLCRSNLMVNSVATGALYEFYSTSQALSSQSIAARDYNGMYNNTANLYQISSQNTAVMGGNPYNVNTRNVAGVVINDTSYAMPYATPNTLALTVNTPDVDETLAWGGGTPVQLVAYSAGTLTSVTPLNSWATTLGTTTVGDTGRSWPTAYNNAATPSGMWLKITGGTGAGQISRIMVNTATTLTVMPAFTTLPVAGSTYAVYKSQVQCYDSGGTNYVWLGVDARSLPTTTQTGSGITFTTNAITTQNPTFVDNRMRDLALWDASLGGSGGDNSAWQRLLGTANSSLGTVISAAVTWLKAGYSPTNSAFRAASYPADASTADANGNAWPGGSPGIGAMGVYTGGIPGGIPLLFPMHSRPTRRKAG